jgi:hypothetical protein
MRVYLGPFPALATLEDVWRHQAEARENMMSPSHPTGRSLRGHDAARGEDAGAAAAVRDATARGRRLDGQLEISLYLQ